MMTDTIADFLTQVRNANMVRHTSVEVSYSRMRQAIADILKREGYISTYKIIESEKKENTARDTKATTATSGEAVVEKPRPYKMLHLVLSDDATSNEQSRISHIKRISKPSRRTYVSHKDIPRPLRGMGTVILSTSSGVITGKEAAKRGLGGEILCEIW